MSKRSKVELQSKERGENMEFNSPQPEHAQLSTVVHPKGTSRLLAALHQQVVGATAPRSGGPGLGGCSIDSALDEHLIPSPPLSPKMSSVDEGSAAPAAPVAPQVPAESTTALWVKPDWESSRSPESYRSATSGFLSQYRCFDFMRTKRYTHPNNKTLRKTRNYTCTPNYTSGGSDFEKVYRTRRSLKNAETPRTARGHAPAFQEDFTRHGMPSRPATPTNRNTHRKVNSVTSPLASSAVLGAPQYVPSMSWEKLPDYSPPLSTLPANNKCLKVEWKGSSMDLSADPLRHLLHPAELQLAQILRLPCDLYLDSKRRLFVEKVHRLKQDLPFRRTDAQKACRIDVNKASRLFAAYERIGWLEDENFERFF